MPTTGCSDFLVGEGSVVETHFQSNWKQCIWYKNKLEKKVSPKKKHTSQADRSVETVFFYTWANAILGCRNVANSQPSWLCEEVFSRKKFSFRVCFVPNTLLQVALKVCFNNRTFPNPKVGTSCCRHFSHSCYIICKNGSKLGSRTLNWNAPDIKYFTFVNL